CLGLGLDDGMGRRLHSFPLSAGLYGDLPPTAHEAHEAHEAGGSGNAAAQGASTILGGLPLPFPNPAPEVDLSSSPTTTTPQAPAVLKTAPGPTATAPYTTGAEALNEPRKKKYAKEAWPGKKPTPSLLI
ncbi:nuclear inhibitor of protein phosphatase 1-like, partial [Engraulis encrasicolus]|uniref:nuclear inhibitor of protein phosphatase 1-like n=1 Tax=Engraulis encrasicolus TaxID=184585 RepID=UPI002FCFB90B